MLSRAITEHEHAPLEIQLRDAIVEEFAQALFGAPECRRFDACGWWNVLANRAEDMADEAIRCPIRQADRAAWLADTQQLLGCLLLIGRKHHAEDREHHVERTVGERQIFGVGFLECDRQAFGSGPLAPALE